MIILSCRAINLEIKQLNNAVIFPINFCSQILHRFDYFKLECREIDCTVWQELHDKDVLVFMLSHDNLYQVKN